MNPLISIDAEFQSLIPPPSIEEFALLKQQILERGCLEPLYVWKDGDNRILLDGHNRYKICTESRVQFNYVKVPSVASREEAKLWILEHQAGRRNLTDDQRAIVWNDIRESRSKLVQAENLQKARQAKANGSISAKLAEPVSSKKDTRNEVAKEAKLPESKLRQAQGLKKADPKLYEEVRRGESTLRAARKGLRTGGTMAKPKKDRDYFCRLGRRLDGVFKGEVRKRLDELSRLKADQMTSTVEQGLRELIPILKEVAECAANYASKFDAATRTKKAEAA
jgi:hypothetical protein